MNCHVFLLAAVVAFGPSQACNADQQSPVEPLEVEMFYQYSTADDDAEVTIDVESSIAIDRLSASVRIGIW